MGETLGWLGLQTSSFPTHFLVSHVLFMGVILGGARAVYFALPHSLHHSIALLVGVTLGG